MRGIQLIVSYTAGFVGGRDGLANWQDLMNKKQQDERSGDEIAAEVIRRAGLRSENHGSI